jgi:hypothetical protein
MDAATHLTGYRLQRARSGCLRLLRVGRAAAANQAADEFADDRPSDAGTDS